jgi:hypothetical protein
MVVDKFGRRILLILSGVVMCVSLVGLGVFFYIKEHQCFDNSTALTNPTNKDNLSMISNISIFKESIIINPKSFIWQQLLNLLWQWPISNMNTLYKKSLKIHKENNISNLVFTF